MSRVANLQSETAPILACTISQDVQNFDLLIDDMEVEMGEAWGDLSFDDALYFLAKPDAASLQFVAVAVNSEDEDKLGLISDIVRQAKTSGIKVILVADQISPMALHQLLRMGADDFIPYPLPDGTLHDAIERAKAPSPATQGPMVALAAAEANVLHAPDAAAKAPAFRATGDRDGVVLPVHGLAGGVGASTFATNLAYELANLEKNGPRVCLLDFDFQYGSTATYLDLPRKDAVFELLSDTANADSDQLLRAMLTFNDKLHVLTAPSDMLPLDIIAPEDIERIINMARANFDYVVIDMPKTIVAWTETVLTYAHVYFALIELDLRSAQNVLRLVRALKAEGLPHEKLRFALNKAPRFTELSAKSRAKRMAESLGISIEVSLPDGGVQVTEANDHGMPLSEQAAKNPLRKEIQKLAKSLHELNKAADTGKN